MRLDQRKRIKKKGCSSFTGGEKTEIWETFQCCHFRNRVVSELERKYLCQKMKKKCQYFLSVYAKKTYA